METVVPTGAVGIQPHRGEGFSGRAVAGLNQETVTALSIEKRLHPGP